MSNVVPPPSGLGIGTSVSAGTGQRVGNVTLHVADVELPNGKSAVTGVRVGDDIGGDPTMRASRREEFLINTYPPSLTEGLERDIARFEEAFNDILGYDRDGKPLYRVTGRDRELLEMRLGTRRNALKLAWEERRTVEAYQKRRQAEAAAADVRINAAAAARAVELAEEAEIERRAKLIARRASNQR
ncbi:hypothetical protein [Lysobacter sp. M2-1]|uniref:hypothetical protein n=1 Tax=Lysobacter sp. M2-1 TaxID=2916839 RepID=UPI001F59668E|nr:hypothetical protein [Lysobacter sp. M2-1]